MFLLLQIVEKYLKGDRDYLVCYDIAIVFGSRKLQLWNLKFNLLYQILFLAALVGSLSCLRTLTALE